VPALVATRQDGDASWWGWAIYALRLEGESSAPPLRFEFFDDPQSGADGDPEHGESTSIYEVDGDRAVQDLEGPGRRFDVPARRANAKVFAIRAPQLRPTERVQDTLSVDLYYLSSDGHDRGGGQGPFRSEAFESCNDCRPERCC